MIFKIRNLTFRILPLVGILAFLALAFRISDLSYLVEPISVAKAQEKNNDDKTDNSKELEEDDLGDATLQDALEEDAKSSSGPGKPIFTAAELDVLENLSARRKILEERSKELDLRENLLLAAQQKVEDKITELKNIESTIKSLLTEHDVQEEKKLKSLVKVYESMKSKDAARIFEELDLDILVDVAELMEERKLAPVLANMDPVKAKAVTTEIRTRRKLPENNNANQTKGQNLTNESVNNENNTPSS